MKRTTILKSGLTAPPASSLLNFEEVVIPVFDIDVLMMSLLDRKDRGLDEMVVLGE